MDNKRTAFCWVKGVLAIFRAWGREEDALFRSPLRMYCCPNARGAVTDGL